MGYDDENEEDDMGYDDENEEDDDFDLQDELREGYTLGQSRDGISVAEAGRYLRTFKTEDQALRFIYEKMEKDGYFPNVFFVNERGNADLLALSRRKGAKKVTSKIVRSWV